MDKTSEALFALKPVNFRYKPEISPDHAERFGLIAEEVDKINPDLVSHDTEGKPLTVRYESINAMLLNEFLKEHRKVEQLQTTIAKQAREFQSAIAQQQKEMETVVARLQKQEAKIQKVSAQIELNKRARRTVANK